MIGLLILIALIGIGAGDKVLRWQPFAWMLPSSLFACWFQSMMDAGKPNILGEAQVDMFNPVVFLVNWAAVFVMWSLFYLMGHAAGRCVRWLQGRKKG